MRSTPMFRWWWASEIAAYRSAITMPRLILCLSALKPPRRLSATSRASRAWLTCDPATPEELLQTFSLGGLREKFPDLVQIQWR